MSKIAEYTNAPLPLSGNDKLIGSSADDENSTRNFTLDELNDYFSGSINPPTPYTLQDILDNGNSATQNIVLTGNVTATRVITPNIQDVNGTTGTTNQILSKGASGIVWINDTTNNLQNVLNNGNTATQNIILTGNITSTRAIPTNIQDVLGSIGTTNQVLIKGASGITWSTPSVNNLQSVLDSGNTATQSIFLTGNITTTRIIPVNIQDVNASVGVTSQVLSKGASGIVWTSLPTNTLQTVLNAGNSATQNIVLTGNITSTRIIPSSIQDETGGIGTAGQVLSRSATGISWINASAAAVSQIVAGTNITISPAGGTGVVTINATSGSAQNLQSVLNTGNTATQNIVLTGNITSTISIPTNIQDVTASIGSTNQILSKGASGIVWINAPTYGLQSILDTNNNATQNINLTGTVNATRLNATNIQDVTASIGTTNQILSKGASGVLWINQATPTLQAVLNSGNVATQNITLVGDISATKMLPTNIQDVSASTGTVGQVLSKGASGIVWANPTSSAQNLQSVLNTGNTATQNITLVGDMSATKVIATNIQDVSSSTGTVGQVLSKGASGLLWINSSGTPTIPGGTTGNVQFNNAGSFGGSNNLYWDNTNSVLGIGKSNPLSSLSLDAIGGGRFEEILITNGIISVQTTKSSNYTLKGGDEILWVDASSGNINIGLPPAASTFSVGRRFTIKKVDETNNKVIILPNGSETIEGQASYSISARYDFVEIVSNGTNWRIVSSKINNVYYSSSNYTVTDIDDVLLGNAGGNNVNFTLPSAVGRTGKIYTIKALATDPDPLIGPYAVYVVAASGETIDGLGNVPLPVQYDYIMVVSDGANWYIISEKFNPLPL